VAEGEYRLFDAGGSGDGVTFRYCDAIQCAKCARADSDTIKDELASNAVRTWSSYRRDEGLEDRRVRRVPDHDHSVFRVVPQLVRPAMAARRNRSANLMAGIQVDDLDRTVAIARPRQAAILPGVIASAIASPIAAVFASPIAAVFALAAPVRHDDDAVRPIPAADVTRDALVWAACKDRVAGANKSMRLCVVDIKALVAAVGEDVSR
jgi:hypothetical protein